MLRTVQFLHPFNGEQVGSDAAYFCSHPVEHAAELLQVGFASGIVDSGGTLCQHGSHQNIGGSCHGRFIEQHIVTLKPAGSNLIDSPRLVVAEIGSQILNPHKVGIKTTATDFISTRLRDQRFPETRHHRTDQHHRPPKTGTLFQELIALQIG